jgi:hypothetical protein
LRVSSEPGAVELLRRYRLALNYAINKILSLNLKTVRKVHRELYRELREWFGLPPRWLFTAIGMPLQMQRLGEETFIRVGGLGLRSLACCCTMIKL